MSYESSEIIVLRVVSYSESSQIVDAVSPEFGKLSLIAKGIRKLPKNSVGSPFDLLCHAKVDFRAISTEGLEAVSENIVVSYFPALRKSLKSWFAGILITEISRQIVQPRNPEGKLYRVLRRTLYEIEDGADYRIALLYFFSGVLDALGVNPLRKLCTRSNLPLIQAPRVAWIINDVSAYLPKFAPVNERVEMMQGNTYKVFSKFASGINKPLRKINLPERVIVELSSFFKKLMESTIERKLHTFKYIRW
ncbi:MAG: DNA repair protein RecO [Planctomycetes bacterium]|nr:DNA repair protein RecO [Planctomycetota bacterium]